MNTDDEQKKDGIVKRLFSSKSKKNKKNQNNSQEYDNYSEYYSDGYLENDSNNDYSNDKSDDNIYQDFYSTSNNKEVNQEEYYDDSSNKGKMKILIIILLMIVLGILIWFFITVTSKKELPDINLLVTDINLKVGENKYISYEMVHVTDVIKVNFESANPAVAAVDENGNVLGVSAGNTTVSLKYKSGSQDKEKICNVVVIDDGGNKENPNNNSKTEEPNKNTTVPQTPPNLSVSASTTSWTNKNVVVKASASSTAGGSVSLSYAINCSQNCNYTKTDGSITVSNNGTNTVTVVATDSKNNKQAIKSVTVKIDKTAPQVSVMNYQSKYESKTAGIQVCAACTDNGSGCKESKVCKIYTETASNQTIQIQDNAGNVGTSQSFDIIINK